MVLPSKDSFDTYGGEKSDFVNVVDPSTDRSASEINHALASTSMLTRMTSKAFVQWIGISSDPVVTIHEALWGNGFGVLPVITRIAQGHFVVTWQPSVTDPLGDLQSINLTAGFISMDGLGSGIAVSFVKRVSPNTVEIRFYDLAGATTDADNSVINLWVF